MNDSDILEVIRKRWSPYSFSPGTVEDEKIMSLFRAAGMAPSSMNEQPWLFVWTTREDPKVFSEYISFLVDSNRIWAQNAYALAISFARLYSSYNGKLNRYAMHDTGMAVGNLLLQASSMNICVHQMGGFHRDKIAGYFRLRDGVEPVAVMAIGYKGDGSGIPRELFKRDEERRPRKGVNEYSFRERLPSDFTS